MPQPDAIAQFLEQLDYQFSDPALLERALTHASQSGRGGADSNERMEFLGDRVLGLVIAELVFKTFPDEQEGALARRHTALVCREALAEVAIQINLGPMLSLSEGEKATGGRENPSILADGMEAVIAAIYLDGGLAPAKAFIEARWTPLLNQDLKPPKDAKTALQEWAQGQGLELPVYEEIGRSGPDHAPIFEISVTIEGRDPVTAKASNKRQAEKQAAELLLSKLKA